MINQLLTVLHYTGLLALCLPSLFFIVCIVYLLESETHKARVHNLGNLFFWGRICAAEYLLALGVKYMGGVL